MMSDDERCSLGSCYDCPAHPQPLRVGIKPDSPGLLRAVEEPYLVAQMLDGMLLSAVLQGIRQPLRPTRLLEGGEDAFLRGCMPPEHLEHRAVVGKDATVPRGE